MIKKIFLFSIILFSATVFAEKDPWFESTPFKIVKDKLIVVADVTPFEYNCIELDDGSILYEVLPSATATSGTMMVTIYCQQFLTTINLPLTKQGNRLATPVTMYPIKFSKTAPAACHAFSNLQIVQSADFPNGYVLRVRPDKLILG